MPTETKRENVEKKKHDSEELDHQLEDSFPASDPPAIVTPHPPSPTEPPKPVKPTE